MEQGRPLLILATTSNYSVLTQLQLSFDANIAVPYISRKQELGYVMHESGLFNEQEINAVLQEITATTGSEQLGVGVRKVLTAIQTAQHSDDKVERFAQIISEAVAENVEQ